MHLTGIETIVRGRVERCYDCSNCTLLELKLEDIARLNEFINCSNCTLLELKRQQTKISITTSNRSNCTLLELKLRPAFAALDDHQVRIAPYWN